MKGYICHWQSQRIEVHAETSYGAQKAAQIAFQSKTRKRVKGYDISVNLAERDGEQVTTTITN